MVEDIVSLTIFSDSPGAMQKVIDPSVHSRQSQSIKTCEHLETWLSANPVHKVNMYYVPSKMEWAIHHRAHVLAKAHLSGEPPPRHHRGARDSEAPIMIDHDRGFPISDPCMHAK